MRTRYDIVKYPASVLAREAEDVYPSKDYFEGQLTRFRRACTLAQGVAVAAPQLGVPSQFFYYRFEGEEFLAVNPIIDEVSDELVTDTEACLSVPGRDFVAPRHEWITWSWDDPLTGLANYAKATGWKARIIQHEIDHLKGLCLPDRFPEA